MDDKLGSGTIYRIAPKGFVSKPPAFDASSIDGLITALRSPAVNVRAIGFEGLKARGAASLNAVAALLTNSEPLRNYLEVVGDGRPLTKRSAPFVAIPTTAGTGAEVTRNAVLMVEEARVKVSLRSPLMLPAVALIDPELTYTLPPAVTASTGLDALTQCIEPFVTPYANPLADAISVIEWATVNDVTIATPPRR